MHIRNKAKRTNGGAKIDARFLDDFLQRFVEYDKISVTADNITIKGKYDEIAKNAIASKINIMKKNYEKQQGITQN